MSRKWHINLHDFILKKSHIECCAAPDEKRGKAVNNWISKQMNVK